MKNEKPTSEEKNELVLFETLSTMNLNPKVLSDFFEHISERHDSRIKLIETIEGGIKTKYTYHSMDRKILVLSAGILASKLRRPTYRQDYRYNGTEPSWYSLTEDCLFSQRCTIQDLCLECLSNEKNSVAMNLIQFKDFLDHCRKELSVIMMELHLHGRPYGSDINTVDFFLKLLERPALHPRQPRHSNK